MAPRVTGRSGPIDERAFHRWLAHRFRPTRGVRLGIGDDAAVLLPPAGQVVVLTTDSLVEGTHFLADSPPERIGRAAAAVSLSDAAAKGARPAGLLIALVVPPGTPTAWAMRVVEGADREGRAAGAPLVGGDTKPGPVRAVVSTVVGWGRADHLAARSGARPGDLLVTTGVVGRGGWASHRLASAHDPTARRRALSELLDVRPRVREGIALSSYAHAMMDTSDGLADSTILLAAASRVRVLVEEATLPLLPALVRARLAPNRRRSLALYGGDYELLAAIPPGSLRAAARAVRRARGRLTVIGRVEAGRGAYLVGGGGPVRMPPGGWRPFGAARGR
jgi:thiamine-monophosphate kinase